MGECVPLLFFLQFFRLKIHSSICSKMSMFHQHFCSSFGFFRGLHNFVSFIFVFSWYVFPPEMILGYYDFVGRTAVFSVGSVFHLFDFSCSFFPSFLSLLCWEAFPSFAALLL